MALVAAMLPPSVSGQTSVTISVDNDYFNFWVVPNRRPDEGYSQGIRVEVGWGGRVGHDPSGRVDLLAVGQEIFTPFRDAVEPVFGDRPYAGFLFLELGRTGFNDRVSRELSAKVGITGRPSFGEEVQSAFHRRFGFREPLGWDHQIPFEVAFAFGYEERRRVARVGARDGGVALGPLWGASLGTIRVDARLGGWTQGTAEVGPLHVFGGVAAWGEWVGRDLFLDGSTFGESPSVERRMTVGAIRPALGIEVGEFILEYEATFRTREFVGQPYSHAYGTIKLGAHR